MKKTKMSPRSRMILQRLCKEDAYVTIAGIAEELEVSGKTIMRELPETARILAELGVSLEKKAGAGIGIQGGAAARQRVLEALETAEASVVFSPQERQIVIISRLLQSQEPIKLYELASGLKVTEGTISNDLDKLEPWFADRSLVLVRKPGRGVYVEGEERDIRKAIVHYIYEHINEEELLALLHENLADDAALSGTAASSSRYLLNLVDGRIIRALEQAIREAEEETRYKLSDGAYIGLIVHLALAVQRIRKDERIVMEAEFLAKLKSGREFSIAAKIAARIAEIFDIFVPEDEIGYITMHLLGARNQYGAGKPVSNFELVKLAKTVMRTAQEETGRSLLRDEKLLIGLVHHLGPALSRLQMNLEIRNPLLTEMRENYPELFAIAQKCAAALERELRKPLPEAEVAYLAMHVGAALQDSRAARRSYRVAVACPTGMGTSRMLAAKLRKTYGNLQIVDLVSAIRLDAAQLERLRVDFILSTVSIAEAPVPVVVVNSLLKPEDCGRIDRQLALLAGRKREEEPRRQPQSLRERLCLLRGYADAIVALLDHLFVLDDASAETTAALTHLAADAATDAPERAAAIAVALAAREAYSATALQEQALVLLHCRSEAVEKLQFGVIHPRRFTESPSIKTALVLLAPEDCAPSAIETIGHLSALLSERWDWVELLHKGGKDMIYLELVKIFTVFYQEKNKLLMEE